MFKVIRKGEDLVSKERREEKRNTHKREHIVPVARLEVFRALKPSRLEAFRVLKPYCQIGGF